MTDTYELQRSAQRSWQYAGELTRRAVLPRCAALEILKARVTAADWNTGNEICTHAQHSLFSFHIRVWGRFCFQTGW